MVFSGNVIKRKALIDRQDKELVLRLIVLQLADHHCSCQCMPILSQRYFYLYTHHLVTLCCTASKHDGIQSTLCQVMYCTCIYWRKCVRDGRCLSSSILGYSNLIEHTIYHRIQYAISAHVYAHSLLFHGRGNVVPEINQNGRESQYVCEIVNFAAGRLRYGHPHYACSFFFGIGCLF